MRLSKKQNEYIVNATHRWNIKSGAVRSGKSYVDTAFVIPFRIRERTGKPGLNVILGVSKESIERNVLQPMREIYTEELIGQINNRNVAMICGEEVYCLGAEKVSQVAKIQGASIKYCYGDEIAKWNKEVFQMLKSRLDKPYSCFDGACNPEHPTHWLKEFLDNDELDIYLQRYTIFDNPFLPQEFVEQLCKEYEGTIYYDRLILGLWKRAEGAIYKRFADKREEFTKNMETLYRIISVDAETGNYGRLYVNDTFLPCQIYKTKKSGWKGYVYTEVVLTFLAPELSWITVLEKRFYPQEQPALKSGLNFPFNFPFNFADEKRGSSSFEIDHIIPSDFEMIIYGPCVNPRVLINGYPYEILTTLESNEYLALNTLEETVVKYLSNGTIANLFDVRGYDYSIFEKIPSGLVSVNWSGDFGIDLYIFLKRKEAAW